MDTRRARLQVEQIARTSQTKHNIAIVIIKKKDGNTLGNKGHLLLS